MIIGKDTPVTRESIIKLLTEAKQTTALFAAWFGGLKPNNDIVMVMPYFLKWIDVTDLAVANMKDDTPEDKKRQMAEDLVTLMIVPLRGMMEAVQKFSKEKNLQIAPPGPPPTDVYGYKKWATDYINAGFKMIKDHQATTKKE
jgi:hypothetical protein